ncbi:hypothetical protein EIP91_004374 [Steccherinum ochraceum]|uniref:Uncharacterized protein n=1 Tax=Steccherinum ochraceum TaxID=92696 RepID=A0A4R0RUE3_9APHY|nr:hypothetical protein EIP91_004374 [Steccherinum ochraceum]
MPAAATNMAIISVILAPFRITALTSTTPIMCNKDGHAHVSVDVTSTAKSGPQCCHCGWRV